MSLVSRPVLLLEEAMRVAREESWAVGCRGRLGTLSRDKACGELCGQCPDKDDHFQTYGGGRRMEDYRETQGRSEDYCLDRRCR